MKETILLYPAPGFHHMVSMVELGKLIIQHNPNFSITILVSSTPSETSTTSSYINLISNSTLPISFFSLPSIHPPPSPPPNLDLHETQQRTASVFHSISLNVLHVLDALRTISHSYSVLAFITSLNLFSDYDLFHIPIYFYFTSCASALSFFLYLPAIHNQTSKSFKELNETLLDIPGLPPIKASQMPQPMLHREDPGYHYFLDLGSRLPKLKGIIVNTFDSLEPLAIKAIADGACLPKGVAPPPLLYCIGPLITDAKDRAGTSYDASSECLAWLDGQPRRSVVFLCFGSRGKFSEAQLERMAFGLEMSNQRFLWVVKSPDQGEPDLEVLLPKGFLERTKERGHVVKTWAPQNAILRHESIGGFVTHCGWNSVLEAVSYGVPMVAWPLYAEQHLNAVVLVEEMKLAIPINMATCINSEEGDEEEEGLMVSAEEVEKKVRQIMKLEEGKVVRERSLDMRVMAMAARTKGGSSSIALSKLVASWKQLGKG